MDAELHFWRELKDYGFNRIQGVIMNDTRLNRFDDGDIVTTSEIKERTNDEVVTSTGTVYKLIPRAVSVERLRRA